VQHVAVQCSTAGWGCIDCKKVLFENMRKELDPIRERAAELRAHPERVTEILEAGAAHCQTLASETLREAKELMGLS
jgi:tryptophanyl-tRNA synthetase